MPEIRRLKSTAALTAASALWAPRTRTFSPGWTFARDDSVNPGGRSGQTNRDGL
jgi:hypothetical protein